MLIMASCSDPPTVPQVGGASPVQAGQARIWFYRDWQPFESLNLANIDVNGSYFGSVANGNAFYRDVPPGRYHIAPVSYNRDFNQDKNVDLAAGQQLYVKILSSQRCPAAPAQADRIGYLVKISSARANALSTASLTVAWPLATSTSAAWKTCSVSTCAQAGL